MMEDYIKRGHDEKVSRNLVACSLTACWLLSACISLWSDSTVNYLAWIDFVLANFFYFLSRVRYSFQQNSGCNENTRSCPLQLLCTWFEPYTYRWRFWKSSTSCSSFRKRESHSKTFQIQGPWSIKETKGIAGETVRIGEEKERNWTSGPTWGERCWWRITRRRNNKWIQRRSTRGNCVRNRRNDWRKLLWWYFLEW